MHHRQDEIWEHAEGFPKISGSPIAFLAHTPVVQCQRQTGTQHHSHAHTRQMVPIYSSSTAPSLDTAGTQMFAGCIFQTPMIFYMDPHISFRTLDPWRFCCSASNHECKRVHSLAVAWKISWLPLAWACDYARCSLTRAQARASSPSRVVITLLDLTATIFA